MSQKPGLVSREASKITLTEKEIRLIDRTLKIDNYINKHEDWRDYSIHPSYTNFKSRLDNPYRYTQARDKYERQFQREIQKDILEQERAYSAACLARIMSITTLWPPLHTACEYAWTKRNVLSFDLSKKEKERIKYLKKNVIQ